MSKWKKKVFRDIKIKIIWGKGTNATKFHLFSTLTTITTCQTLFLEKGWKELRIGCQGDQLGNYDVWVRDDDRLKMTPEGAKNRKI